MGAALLDLLDLLDLLAQHSTPRYGTVRYGLAWDFDDTGIERSVVIASWSASHSLSQASINITPAPCEPKPAFRTRVIAIVVL